MQLIHFETNQFLELTDDMWSQLTRLNIHVFSTNWDALASESPVTEMTQDTRLSEDPETSKQKARSPGNAKWP